ncbi:hypothetical protein [Alienimonas californiensis]|uniref:Uncharacterized protein n=1 Tax=Alienimonas californiensis TaxID=2527989 RepID=A0A517P726_9PLAN|nr:hypothetical protein [Alienimonas californiensis]QDT15162.1 hypothetical protein CA12_12430 [Alienimonas californiensis]
MTFLPRLPAAVRHFVALPALLWAATLTVPLAGCGGGYEDGVADPMSEEAALAEEEEMSRPPGTDG